MVQKSLGSRPSETTIVIIMDKNKVYIFDDIISPEVQDNLINKIPQIPFRWTPNLNPNPPKINIKDSHIWNQNRPGLLQSFQYERGQWENGALKWFVLPAFDAISTKLNIIPELQKIKINFNYKDHPFNAISCFHPHCDLEEEDSWTAIYYVNESDGDTLIFEEKGMGAFFNEEELNIKSRVKNKKGRIVIFNQLNLHTGMPPINSNNRIVINYNFKI